MPFIPDRASSFTPSPSYHVDASKSAFGGAFAEALESFGGDIRKSSNELYDRAIAMQELQNKAAATDATTKFMVESGKLHADYQSTLGKDAVEGLPSYQERLQQLRDDIGKEVGNPQARKMYDSESKGTMGRTLFNAAGHAATEQKRWLAGSSEARISASNDQALSFPNDDLSFQKSLQQVRTEVDNLASIKGFDADQKAEELASRVSTLTEKRISGLAKTQPFAADKMLTEAVSNGTLRGESIAKVTNIVNNQKYSIGSREISRDVNSGAGLGILPAPMPQAKASISRMEGNGSYQQLGPEVIGKNGVSRGRALGKYQVMPENLVGENNWLKQSGLPPMSPEQFLDNGPAQEKVFETMFGGMMKKHGNFADAASEWHSGLSLKDAAARGRGDGYMRTTDYVRGAVAYLAKNASLSDREERVRAKAKELSPEDPLMEDYAVQRAHTDYNLAQQTERNDDLNRKLTVEGGLVGMQGDGKLPTTVDELKGTSPEVAAAWDNMKPDAQRRYMSMMAKNAKGDRSLTAEGLKRYQEIKGMAQSDPKEFLDLNVLDEELPIREQKEFVNLQMKMKDKAETDPRVTHAMGVLRPMLLPAGLDRTKDKPGYDQFVGALQDQLGTYQEINKKPADAKAINDIGARLLQQKSSPEFWYGKDNFFKLPVPAADIERIKALPAWGQINIEPTDEQIQRVYTREQYNLLYGAKATKEEKPVGPQVPR